MVLFGEEKQKVWGEISIEEKMLLSAQDKKIAAEFHIRNCQTHLVNILSQNYVGGRMHCEQARQNPDKLAATHGKVEYYVQSRMCAADILRRHIDLAAG